MQIVSVAVGDTETTIFTNNLNYRVDVELKNAPSGGDYGTTNPLYIIPSGGATTDGHMLATGDRAPMRIPPGGTVQGICASTLTTQATAIVQD